MLVYLMRHHAGLIVYPVILEIKKSQNILDFLYHKLLVTVDIFMALTKMVFRLGIF